MSISTFCGQNYGAKKPDRVYSGYRTGTVIMAALTAVLIFAMQFFGEAIGRFTIPYFMTVYLGFGRTGIWLSAGVVWVLSAFTAWLGYKTYTPSLIGPKRSGS